MPEILILLSLVLGASTMERFFLLSRKDQEIQRLTNLLAARSAVELEQIERLGHPQARKQADMPPKRPKVRLVPDNL